MATSRAAVFRYLPAMLATASGLVITAFLFAGVRSLEHDQAETWFRQHASVRIATVKEEMLRAVDALKTLNHFFRSLGAVDREQFHTFATAMLETNPSIRSFSFQRLLTQAERPAYEAAMRKHYPDFSIGKWVDGKRIPVGPMRSYRVVDYLEPMQGNGVAFGLDASSIPKQFDAMQRARDTGLPSASELLVLIKDREVQRSFIVMMPVYRPGIVPLDIEARRRAVIGFTTAIVRTGTLVQNALRDRNLLSDATISVGLYAADTADEHALAFRIGSDRVVESKNSLGSSWLFYNRPRTVSHTFNVAGKSWHLSVSSQPVWFAQRHLGSAIVLMAGLLATLAGAAYLQARALRSSRRSNLLRLHSARLGVASELLSKDMESGNQERQARQLRDYAIDASDHAVVIASAQGPGYLIEHVNDGFERITGYSSADVVGRNCSFLWGDDDDQPDINKIRAAAHQTHAANLTARLYRKDGTLFLGGVHILRVDETPGQAAHFVAALYNLTAMARYQKELEFQATNDAATGLANHYLLHDRLTQAIAYAQCYADPLWVIAIDFDGMGSIGETFGAPVEKQLWTKIGERLQSVVRVTDSVARLTGGEFLMLLTGHRDECLPRHVVTRILHTIKQPITVADHEFAPHCNVGVAIYPGDGETSETLVTNACMAIRRARSAGLDMLFHSVQAAPALQEPVPRAG